MSSATRISQWSLIQRACFGWAGLYLATGVLADALGAFDESGEVADIEVAMAVQGFVSLLLIAVAVFDGRRLGDAKGFDWRGRAGVGFHVVGAYAVFLVFWVPFTFVLYPWIVHLLDVELEPQPHLEYFTSNPSGLGFYAVIATVCVIGPIVEEILFRAYLQTGMRRLIPRIWSLVIVSALFGLMHGKEIALPLALMGGFFGWLRERDDGLFAPMLAHVLHNSATVFVTMGWPELFNEVYSG